MSVMTARGTTVALFLTIGLFSVVIGKGFAHQSQPVGTLVDTTYGKVLGKVEDQILKFQGIPFANSPPVRFSSPTAPTAWAPSVWNASEQKWSCPQYCYLPHFFCPPPSSVSEDCLYLNIYVPLQTQVDAGLPVMVFIYGGAYFQGTADTPVYSGISIAKNTDTILVTFNYRLGAFGFLVTDEVAGNFGLQDQRMALQFVKDNIKYFGGDPNKVTLFGESAGGMSTSVHLISPLSKGLFNQVIIESDPYSLEIPTFEESLARAEKFNSYLGCSSIDDLTCMRQKTTDEVLSASAKTEVYLSDLLNFTLQSILPWRPVVDGVEVPDQVLNVVKSGNFNKVPLIIGSNTNEGTAFAYDALDWIDNVEYAAFILAVFKTSSVKVLEKYPVPLNPLDDVHDTLSELLTDYLFFCPSRYLAKTVAAFDIPVWVYHFDCAANGSSYIWGPKKMFCWKEVCHGSELPFVFNSAQFFNLSFTPKESHLSTLIETYWTNFAHHADPNIGGPVDINWDRFGAASGLIGDLQDRSGYSNIKFNTTDLANEFWKADMCDFWDLLGYFH